MSSITFIARYTEDESWEVLEEASDSEDMLAFFRECEIGDIVGLDDPSTYDDKVNFLTTVSRFDLVVPGTMVFAKAHVIDDTYTGLDGTEYDYHWEVDLFAITQPEWYDPKAVAIRACEEVITRGGFCPNCSWRLKGTNFYAKKYGVCDPCGYQRWKKEIETANDPLWSLRQSALWSAQRNHDRIPSWRRSEIERATSEDELNKIIQYEDGEYQDWLATWRMMQ